MREVFRVEAWGCRDLNESNAQLSGPRSMPAVTKRLVATDAPGKHFSSRETRPSWPKRTPNVLERGVSDNMRRGFVALLFIAPLIVATPARAQFTLVQNF